MEDTRGSVLVWDRKEGGRGRGKDLQVGELLSHDEARVMVLPRSNGLERKSDDE